jgi:uncharacterized coiled-coil DUF342 family protein
VKDHEREFDSLDSRLQKAYTDCDTMKQTNDYYEQQITSANKMKDKLKKSVTDQQKKIKALEVDKKKAVTESREFQKVIDNFISI